jgi:hypothetical protein
MFIMTLKLVERSNVSDVKETPVPLSNSKMSGMLGMRNFL